jgi:hypothetical protein
MCTAVLPLLGGRPALPSLDALPRRRSAGGPAPAALTPRLASSPKPSGPAPATVHGLRRVAASLAPQPAGRALLAQLRRVCSKDAAPRTRPPACSPGPGQRSYRNLDRSVQQCAAHRPSRFPGPAQLWPPSLGSRLDLPAFPPGHPPLQRE